MDSSDTETSQDTNNKDQHQQDYYQHTQPLEESSSIIDYPSSHGPQINTKNHENSRYQQSQAFFNDTLNSTDPLPNHPRNPQPKHQKHPQASTSKPKINYKIYDNGDIYVGHIKRSKIHGDGLMVFDSPKIRCEGQWLDNLLHGVGRQIGPGSEKYIGEFSEGIKNGKGKYIDAKQVIMGEFIDGRVFGFAVITDFEKGVITKGNYVNGKLEKFGTIEALNGQYSYAGGFLGGVYEGLGEQGIRGSVYLGGFERGKRNGVGIFREEDGSRYIGNWVEGVKHGFGLQKETSGELYQGGFRNGQKIGLARIYFRKLVSRGRARPSGLRTHPSGAQNLPNAKKSIEIEIYTGKVKNGKMSGFGKLEHPDGSYYIGEWKSGLKHGLGYEHTPQGRSYYGDWKSGKKEGYGFEFQGTELSHKGEWHNGYPHGFALFKNYKGKEKCGIFSEGMLVELTKELPKKLFSFIKGISIAEFETECEKKFKSISAKIDQRCSQVESGYLEYRAKVTFERKKLSKKARKLLKEVEEFDGFIQKILKKLKRELVDINIDLKRLLQSYGFDLEEEMKNDRDVVSQLNMSLSQDSRVLGFEASRQLEGSKAAESDSETPGGGLDAARDENDPDDSGYDLENFKKRKKLNKFFEESFSFVAGQRPDLNDSQTNPEPRLDQDMFILHGLDTFQAKGPSFPEEPRPRQSANLSQRAKLVNAVDAGLKGHQGKDRPLRKSKVVKGETVRIEGLVTGRPPKSTSGRNFEGGRKKRRSKNRDLTPGEKNFRKEVGRSGEGFLVDHGDVFGSSGGVRKADGRSGGVGRARSSNRKDGGNEASSGVREFDVGRRGPGDGFGGPGGSGNKHMMKKLARGEKVGYLKKGGISDQSGRKGDRRGRSARPGGSNKFKKLKKSELSPIKNIDLKHSKKSLRPYKADKDDLLDSRDHTGNLSEAYMGSSSSRYPKNHNISKDEIMSILNDLDNNQYNLGTQRVTQGAQGPRNGTVSTKKREIARNKEIEFSSPNWKKVITKKPLLQNYNIQKAFEVQSLLEGVEINQENLWKIFSEMPEMRLLKVPGLHANHTTKLLKRKEAGSGARRRYLIAFENFLYEFQFDREMSKRFQKEFSSKILYLTELPGSRKVMVITQDNLENVFLDSNNVVYSTFRLESTQALAPRINLGNSNNINIKFHGSTDSFLALNRNGDLAVVSLTDLSTQNRGNYLADNEPQIFDLVSILVSESQKTGYILLKAHQEAPQDQKSLPYQNPENGLERQNRSDSSYLNTINFVSGDRNSFDLKQISHNMLYTVCMELTKNEQILVYGSVNSHQPAQRENFEALYPSINAVQLDKHNGINLVSVVDFHDLIDGIGIFSITRYPGADIFLCTSHKRLIVLEFVENSKFEKMKIFDFLDDIIYGATLSKFQLTGWSKKMQCVVEANFEVSAGDVSSGSMSLLALNRSFEAFEQAGGGGFRYAVDGIRNLGVNGGGVGIGAAVCCFSVSEQLAELYCAVDMCFSKCRISGGELRLLKSTITFDAYHFEAFPQNDKIALLENKTNNLLIVDHELVFLSKFKGRPTAPIKFGFYELKHFGLSEDWLLWVKGDHQVVAFDLLLMKEVLSVPAFGKSEKSIEVRGFRPLKVLVNEFKGSRKWFSHWEVDKRQFVGLKIGEADNKYYRLREKISGAEDLYSVDCSNAADFLVVIQRGNPPVSSQKEANPDSSNNNKKIVLLRSFSFDEDFRAIDFFKLDVEDESLKFRARVNRFFSYERNIFIVSLKHRICVFKLKKSGHFELRGYINDSSPSGSISCVAFNSKKVYRMSEDGSEVRRISFV